jgi:Tfp pilus assembly protein PilN
MIEINLLPEEVRAKNKMAEQTGIPPFLLVIPLVLALLLVAHLVLGVIQGIKSSQLGILNSTWNSLSVKKKEVDEFKSQRQFQAKDIGAVQALLNKRTNWAQKMNRMSQVLPGGIWFTELSISQTSFTLRGSVLSLQKDEFAAINVFLEALKNDKAFYDGFTSLELGPLKRKRIGEYEVFDFILNGVLS